MDEIHREAARVFHEVQRTASEYNVRGDPRRGAATARGERDGVARERVRAVGAAENPRLLASGLKYTSKRTPDLHSLRA